MAFTPRTAEERDADLAKAKAARTERSGLKASLKAGTTTLADVIAAAAANPVVAKTKVADLVRSLPGVGPVRAAQIMERLGIDARRRVGGLGANQRAALEQEFAPVAV